MTARETGETALLCPAVAAATSLFLDSTSIANRISAKFSMSMFSREELLALFPFPGPRTSTPTTLLSPGNKNGSDTNPTLDALLHRESLTFEQLYTIVAPECPWEVRKVKIARAIQPWGARLFLRNLIRVVFQLPVIWLGLYVFSDGRFSAKQAAVGAGTATFMVLVLLGSIARLTAARHRELKNREVDGKDKTHREKYNDTSYHSLVPIARYMQAAGLCDSRDENGLGKPETPPVGLLSHDAGNPACPCPLESCSRPLLHVNVLSVLLSNRTTMWISAMFMLFSGYTSLVTFASTWWTKWWSALLGVLFCEFTRLVIHVQDVKS